MNEWTDLLSQVHDYILKNNERPSRDVGQNQRIGRWLHQQVSRHKSGKWPNETYQKAFEQFITDPLIAPLFEDRGDIWNRNLTSCYDLILEKGMRPSKNSEDEKERLLESWLNKQQGMRQSGKWPTESRQKAYEEFVTGPLMAPFFATKPEIWKQNLKALGDYFSVHKRPPSQQAEILEEKQLGFWFTLQQTRLKSGKWTDKEYQILYEEFATNSKYIKFSKGKNVVEAHEGKSIREEDEVEEGPVAKMQRK